MTSSETEHFYDDNYAIQKHTLVHMLSLHYRSFVRGVFLGVDANDGQLVDVPFDKYNQPDPNVWIKYALRSSYTKPYGSVSLVGMHHPANQLPYHYYIHFEPQDSGRVNKLMNIFMRGDVASPIKGNILVICYRFGNGTMDLDEYQIGEIKMLVACAYKEGKLKTRPAGRRFS
ncbi:hypothetical protein CONPUDRAFT_155409 [Coniophora puteana RWD-64-598 SS2]|uniref:Uncharacterized protein n=1 Tax=Coniophora puteana (strain RWD-64-598) TaxID=741705 RepID=A0A5M3MMM4_CONPW|nr:uncharacterized protein CONPUDRAFT_155409 [Coniophora puteana RWD-64-598 SS2]EIW80034.1 hypothetical protein CONPUDRAFT_155409 [Coniophora puteana RWD-64-598 SS2]